MQYIHKDLAVGRWFELSLAEQMGNIGSEVHRALNRQAKNDEVQLFSATNRALELLHLTIKDPRWKNGLKELTRLKEVLADVVFGQQQYQTTLEDLDNYFMQFALVARKRL